MAGVYFHVLRGKLIEVMSVHDTYVMGSPIRDPGYLLKIEKYRLAPIQRELEFK